MNAANKDPSEEDVVLNEDAQALCPQCMTRNDAEIHFCEHCGAPLSSFAATAPFERLLAEGHIYRSVAERPHSRFLVVGVWIIFGPSALFATGGAIMAWTYGDPMTSLIGLSYTILSIALISRTTRNFRRLQGLAQTTTED